ncbi:MAG: type II toxin-antitoxin system VapC family toxin [Planctomycetes bacterium]|nr:type II toxin-antitoxin system VapC family toxin [Planctomycetota bacterium]
MSSTPPGTERVFFDAGLFIAALCERDERHEEARPLVEAARGGTLPACTTASVLSEVYAVLTWERTEWRLDPADAAGVVDLLIHPRSAIEVLACGHETARRAMRLAAAHGLTARRIHDARHAAAALLHGLQSVYTYDVADWGVFEADGLRIIGPPSVLPKRRPTAADRTIGPRP